ncbi:MAG: hypothetical protein ABIN20_06895 [candidate division WOR-3 bacterium]
MRIKKLKVIIYVILSIFIVSCGESPGIGAGKWGETEADIMSGYNINTFIIENQVKNCGNTNKKLTFIYNETLSYDSVKEIGPYSYINLHKSLNTMFYLAVVSKFKQNPYLWGITYHNSFKGSVIFVEPIKKYFGSLHRVANGSVLAHEIGHQLAFKNHPVPIGCIMDYTFTSSNLPAEFCISHKVSLRNLPTSNQILAFSSNLENSFSNFLNSVRESLTLYKDTFYVGEPLTFKVWIINGGKKPIMVGGFIHNIQDLFLDLEITLLLKDKRGEIKKIKPNIMYTLAYTFSSKVLPNDTVYYKFTRYITLSPGKYWVKLKRGFKEGSRKNEWVPFYIKEYPNKKEKELAISYFDRVMWSHIEPPVKKVKKYTKRDKNKKRVEIYEILKKENKNSPYLPYVGLTILDSMVIFSESMSYEDFRNSEYYKDIQKMKDFPYYEDLILFDILFLYQRSYSLRDISLFELIAQRLGETEKSEEKNVYIKIWKENFKEIKNKMIEEINKTKKN